MSVVTVPVAVESSAIRAHARRSRSPAGWHAVFAVNHNRPFSHTDSSTRLSFVSIPGCARPDAVGGCDANGGLVRRVINGVAISLKLTAAGGIPSTANRWTTRDDGSFTETTYSVEVEERDCTGAKLVKSESGPSVVKSGFVEPPSSSCLFRTQSSPPIGTPALSLQLR